MKATGSALLGQQLTRRAALHLAHATAIFGEPESDEQARFRSYLSVGLAMIEFLYAAKLRPNWAEMILELMTRSQVDEGDQLKSLRDWYDCTVAAEEDEG